MKVLILSVILAFSLVPAHAEDKRKVKVAWRGVENSVKYEFEIAESAEMDPLADHGEYKTTEANLQLRPGTYYFRVRGYDANDAPGPWSEVQGFVVNPAPPRQVSPGEGEAFKKELPEGGIEFTWKAGIKGSEYLLQIDDRKGAVLKRGVKTTDFSWTPPGPGPYKWRVGYETRTGGEEWSKFRGFSVGKDAFPRGPASVGKPETSKADEFNWTEEKNRTPEWWLIGRLAQSVVAYTISDQDLGVNASGAALVGLFSAELRWRGGRTPASDWTYSGSANLEIVRQIVLGTEFVMPRGYLRGFYGKESGRWRAGPFLQLHAGQSGIFIAESASNARKVKVMRQGFGLGGVAVYRPSPALGLSGLLLVREDMGGTAAELPNPLSASLGMEAGFGLVLGLGKSTLLEGRLRALSENYKWKPAKGGADDSSMGNLFIILDAGVGFKF